MVLNGWSFNSKEQSWTWLKSLRSDYQPPSAKVLQRRVTSLYEEVDCAVKARVGKAALQGKAS